ncbi:MAG: Ldh family oxidoreductase [Polaromonas sp.]|uniref:Ldh family oxidoreductase n=1 Tax=Polaromonas sp. TaxID=1869339 RepID=UPI002734A1D0|nr:Ldh family oxidoreductase [Polaromonas sp.]MDP3799413.1 Ldh family oxidoreductase [Polaromonas sp.]
MTDIHATAPARVIFAQLSRFITVAMTRLGLPEADAAIVGRLMSEAELQGSDGHGVIRLLPYARRIRAGGLNLRPNIKVVQERPGMALLDGDNGMGHLVMQRAAELAIEKARHCGIAWVGSRFSNHAGPASLYARMPMAHDMIGLYFAVGNANHLPPWGGLDMLLSTNPIAVAVPAGEEPPVVLDMATTVAAYGKVKAKAQRGEMMPPGWMIDRLGQPLLDPKRAEEGFLMPIGGYKGYGLSLIVGLLAGTLNGAAMGSGVIDFNHDDTTTTNTGQAVMAIDLSAFGEVTGFKARVDQLVRELRGSERMPGVDRIWLPGEQSHERRAANERDGMALPPVLLQQLDAFARDMGIPTLQAT